MCFTVKLLFSVYSCGLQLGDDGIDCAGDTAGERGERENDADSDDCQDDAVLGHRLTLLACIACAEVKNQILERHGFTPLQWFERMLARSSEGVGECRVELTVVRKHAQAGEPLHSSCLRYGNPHPPPG